MDEATIKTEPQMTTVFIDEQTLTSEELEALHDDTEKQS